VHPMQGQNRFFDDVARVASGAVGALSSVRGEVEARLRDQLERVLAGMDLVSREEFEAVKAMAAKAREEQELLRRQLEALEARLNGSEPAGSGPGDPGGVDPQCPEAKIILNAKSNLATAAPLWQRSRIPNFRIRLQACWRN